MLSTLTRRATRPALRIAMLLGAMFVVASCKDATETVEPPGPIASAHFTFAMPPDGVPIYRDAAAGASVSITLQRTSLVGSPTVVVYWMKADGTEETRAVAGPYRLSCVVPAGSGIEIVQNQTNLMGCIIKISQALTNVPMTVNLVETASGTSLFGPVTVLISSP
jgi:hypothetical protein